MLAGNLGLVVLAVNPIGGLSIAIPFAVFELHRPAWLALVVGLPFGYVQVLVIDIFWTQLIRWPWWNAFLERRRSPRVEKLVASKGSFWLTVLLAPLIGPWLVMAFMRYAHVPQRKVAIPILLGLCWNAGAMALGCAVAPQLIHRLLDR